MNTTVYQVNISQPTPLIKVKLAKVVPMLH